jgi:catechol 2,3-dioxygenase-like lactoylglutathione lyase family enzyme
MKLLFKTKIKETGGSVAWLSTKGSKQVLELNWYPKRYRHSGRSGLDHLAFEVEDASDAYRRLAETRKAAIAPFKEGKWILAYIKDPDGNWIELGSREQRRRRR